MPSNEVYTKLKPESVFSGAWSKSWFIKKKKGYYLFGSAGPIASITSALFLYCSPHNKTRSSISAPR